MAKVNWLGIFSEQARVKEPAQIESTEQEPKFTQNLATPGGTIVPLKNQRSANYKKNTDGWSTDKNGDAEFNGSVTTSTNFRRVLRLKGQSFWVSNGTTPNGNLNGSCGDLCLRGTAGGQPFYCVSGTVWTAL